MFWWPVIQPFPSVAKWRRWSIPVYLFLATLRRGALGAFLPFCDRVLYPAYAAAPPQFSICPLSMTRCPPAPSCGFGTLVYFNAVEESLETQRG